MVTLNSTKREAKWYVKYSGYPSPTIVWRDTRGYDIPWSTKEDKSHKFEATFDRRSTILKIRNPKITDSGIYILHADNNNIQKDQEFKLFVRGNLFHRVFLLWITIIKERKLVKI